MNQLILASSNPGKIAETKTLAREYGPTNNLEILSLDDIKFDGEIQETGETFEDNARIKVEAVREFLTQLNYPGNPWIAGDDGGLSIDALDGDPGVKTRRWPGCEATDQELIDFCLEQMAGVPEGERQAKFISTIALDQLGSSGVEFFRGETRGSIATENNPDVDVAPGYPLRRLFILEETGQLIGQSGPNVEDALTHRQKSITAALEYIHNNS